MAQPVRTSVVVETAADGSPLLSLLDNPHQKKDTRVFAHAAAETQVAIRESYRMSRDTKLNETLIYGMQEPGFLEVTSYKKTWALFVMVRAEGPKNAFWTSAGGRNVVSPPASNRLLPSRRWPSRCSRAWPAGRPSSCKS